MSCLKQNQKVLSASEMEGGSAQPQLATCVSLWESGGRHWSLPTDFPPHFPKLDLPDMFSPDFTPHPSSGPDTVVE